MQCGNYYGTVGQDEAGLASESAGEGLSDSPKAARRWRGTLGDLQVSSARYMLADPMCTC